MLAADCVGRFIKFRPTTNEQEIAEVKVLLIELYCTTGFFYFTSSFIVFGYVASI